MTKDTTHKTIGNEQLKKLIENSSIVERINKLESRESIIIKTIDKKNLSNSEISELSEKK